MSAGMGRTGITATQHQPARLSLPRPTGRYPVGTFFDRFLCGQPSPLPNGPSPRYPEIQFVR
jgi:hypothetical protein